MNNKVGIRGKGIVFRVLYEDEKYRVGYNMSVNNVTFNSNGSLEVPLSLKYQTKNEDGKWKEVAYEELPNYVQDEVLKEKI